MANSIPTPTRLRVKAQNFALQRLQAFNPLRGGQHQAVDLGEPLWTCELSTADLVRNEGGTWKLFLAQMRGKLRTIFLGDASRTRPLAYATAADGTDPLIGRSKLIGAPRLICSRTRAWGATPKITGVDRANSQIRLEGLNAGAIISDGDYCHWQDGFARRLFICAAATADSMGTAIVTVEPAPPATSTSLPAAIELNQPTAEFIVLKSDAPYQSPVTHQVTMQAAQVLRRS